MPVRRRSQFSCCGLIAATLRPLFPFTIDLLAIGLCRTTRLPDRQAPNPQSKADEAYARRHCLTATNYARNWTSAEPSRSLQTAARSNRYDSSDATSASTSFAGASRAPVMTGWHATAWPPSTSLQFLDWFTHSRPQMCSPTRHYYSSTARDSCCRCMSTQKSHFEIFFAILLN
jgi:hypothetical protein